MYLESLFNLKDKVALVTGASSGFGLHFASVLAKAGAKVALAARRKDRIDSAAQALRSEGAEACAVYLDVSDPATIPHAFDAIENELNACIDILINNADRKGSHVFFENETHKLYAIDHGVCFHEENKLRTVIWDFAGQAIPDELLAPLSQADGWSALFANYLSLTEVVALQNRAHRLLTSRIFPQAPRDRRAFPYPPL